MPLVKLGNELSIYLLCPFLAPVFMLLALFFLDYFDKTNYSQHNNKYDTLMLFFLYLSMICNGFFELCSNVKSKSMNVDLNMSVSIEHNSEGDLQSALTNPMVIYLKSVLIPISVCSGFDILGYIIIMITASREVMYEYIDSEVLIIQMVFLSIISKSVLNYQIYKHQNVSICLSLIGMLFIFSSTVFSYSRVQWTVAFLFFSSMSFSISIVYEKYIMQTKGVSPYKLLFYKGIFDSLFNLLYIIIKEVIYENKFFAPFDILNRVNILLGLPVILCGFAFSLCYVLTNNHFTPCHTGLCDIISSISGWISLRMEKQNFIINEGCLVTFTFCHTIGYILIALSVVIYNEIFIFYVCGMEKDTKSFIMLRSSKDANEAIEAERLNIEEEELVEKKPTLIQDDYIGSYIDS